MLRGKLVGLRAIEEQDLEQLLAWRNNPDYRRYFREHRELSLTQQRRWYQDIVLGDNRVYMFAIVDLATSALLGACGLCYVDWRNRSADFSIYIGADNLYIDDRYAPDVGQALLNYGFNELGLNRIWAEIYDFDEPKQKLFNTLGLSLDGRHRQTIWRDGAWHDSLFYGILKSEFSLVS